MASVTLDNVKKVYAGGVEAVKGITLSMPNNSFTVLLGPSGCGKSTLLRMIAGLETITSGTCKIGNRIVNDIEPAERDIAMVFQNYALYPHMSVYDNMAYGLRNRGTPKDQVDAKVRAAAELLAITPFLDRRPRALSGGQRQRVAMGRAIVREPQAFLFDEPLSNLDAKLRLAMRIEIRRLHNRLKATSIFVTHDQVEAMTLADLVVVMNSGQIEQVGRPSEVYAQPATKFVATFIGAPAMNLLPGRVVTPGTAEIDGGDKLAFDPSVFAAEPGRPVEIGIRPEDFGAATADKASTISFARELVEELGPNRLLHGKVGPHALTVSTAAGVAIPEAAAMRLAAPVRAVHLFDPTSGRSLRAAR